MIKWSILILIVTLTLHTLSVSGAPKWSKRHVDQFKTNNFNNSSIVERAFKTFAEKTKLALNKNPSASRLAKIVADYFQQNFDEFDKLRRVYGPNISIDEYRRELEDYLIENPSAKAGLAENMVEALDRKLAWYNVDPETVKSSSSISGGEYIEFANKIKADLRKNLNATEIVEIIGYYFKHNFDDFVDGTKRANITIDEVQDMLLDELTNKPSILKELIDHVINYIDAKLTRVEINFFKPTHDASKFSLSKDEYEALAKEVKEALQKEPSIDELIEISKNYVYKNPEEFERVKEMFRLNISADEYIKLTIGEHLKNESRESYLLFIELFIRYIDAKLSVYEDLGKTKGQLYYDETMNLLSYPYTQLFAQ